ncbi:MAG: hypothetical protein R8L07_03465 [Alphaproteobacteria bacterium]|nr:hypothetical protein [Alphaproteobacteria bacterium]
MNRSVICYYAKGGQGKVLAPAFAEGCGGEIQRGGPWRGGVAAFYGVKAETEAAWKAARDSAADWFYIDNAYFGRGSYFRITRNAIQHDGRGTADPARFLAHGLTIQEWRRRGDHILVCLQSDNFMMRTCGIDPASWRRGVATALAAHTDRPIVWREKDTARPLRDDFRRCWAVVTHTSNVAVEALLAGIPVFLTGPSAARAMGSGDLSRIEDPPMPDGRPAWAAVLAANQWSLPEIRSGRAWAALQGN